MINIFSKPILNQPHFELDQIGVLVRGSRVGEEGGGQVEVHEDKNSISISDRHLMSLEDEYKNELL